MSIVSGTTAAVLGADAQGDATRANRQNVIETNATNERLFRESRGAGGSAILPTYLDPGQERAIAASAAAAVQRMFPSDPDRQLREYQAIIESIRPTVVAGTDTISSIYDGRLQREREENLAPVLAARTAAADASMDSIRLAEQDMIGRIAAQEAAKGYSGAGSFGVNNLLRAMVQSRAAAAQQKAAADLQNAMESRQVADESTQLRINSVDAPINRATQLTRFEQMPQSALGDLAQQATRPLEFFRISPQAFRVERPDNVSAVPSAAQLALQGMSQTGGQLLSSYLQSNGTLFGGAGWGASTGSNVALQKSLMPGAT
jgi:hypothetical protein